MSGNSVYLTGGRTLQTVVGLFTSIGCYIADYNSTHVFNPNWPPHAKFHNGQTMSFGLTLGLITNFFVWKSTLFPSVLPSINARDSAYLAAVVGSLYWVCGFSAIFYPGTQWLDPEFQLDPHGPPESGPQVPIFGSQIVLAWMGLWLTLKGLASAKGKIS